MDLFGHMNDWNIFSSILLYINMFSMLQVHQKDRFLPPSYPCFVFLCGQYMFPLMFHVLLTHFP